MLRTSLENRVSLAFALRSNNQRSFLVEAFFGAHMLDSLAPVCSENVSLSKNGITLTPIVKVIENKIKKNIFFINLLRDQTRPQFSF